MAVLRAKFLENLTLLELQYGLMNVGHQVPLFSFIQFNGFTRFSRLCSINRTVVNDNSYHQPRFVTSVIFIIL